jgi:hypothetical protein
VKNLYSSRIKSKIDGKCSTHENVRDAYAVTIGKHEGKIPYMLGGDNIEANLEEVEC